jgi:hypothetical protein
MVYVIQHSTWYKGIVHPDRLDRSSQELQKLSSQREFRAEVGPRTNAAGWVKPRATKGEQPMVEGFVALMQASSPTSKFKIAHRIL